MNVNLARVFLGGLLAGVVLNVGEVLFNSVLFANQMDEVFRRLNVPPPDSTFIVVAMLLTLGLGILIVWLYALIRPRSGPGPKTAICAALIVWFCACVYCGILYGLLLRIPTNLVVIGIVWCLVEYSVAAIAGAWLYKENGRSDIAVS